MWLKNIIYDAVVISDKTHKARVIIFRKYFLCTF